MRKAFRYGRTYRIMDGPTLIMENVVCVQLDLINVSNLQKAAAVEINHHVAHPPGTVRV